MGAVTVLALGGIPGTVTIAGQNSTPPATRPPTPPAYGRAHRDGLATSCSFAIPVKPGYVHRQLERGR